MTALTFYRVNDLFVIMNEHIKIETTLEAFKREEQNSPMSPIYTLFISIDNVLNLDLLTTWCEIYGLTDR